MPARKDTDRRSRVHAWLLANPGNHRPVEIAKALDISTHGAATDCIALFNQGRATKAMTPTAGRKPITTYSGKPVEAEVPA